MYVKQYKLHLKYKSYNIERKIWIKIHIRSIENVNISTAR